MEAWAARYQGTLTLDCIVWADGRAHEIKVTKPLGMELDKKAVEAVEQWVFEPGRQHGRPVPVYVSVDVTFRCLRCGAPTEGLQLTNLKLCSDKSADPDTCLQKLPRAKHSPKPQYTKQALREGIQGVVLVQAVVGTDGRPHDIAVVRSLGYGLDEKAVDAVKKWRFHPAIGRDGKPVAAPVTIEIAFQAPAPETR